MHDYSPAGILIAPCPDFLAIAELRTMIMDRPSRILAKTVRDHEKISQSGLQDYAVPSSAHAAMMPPVPGEGRVRAGFNLAGRACAEIVSALSWRAGPASGPGLYLAGARPLCTGRGGHADGTRVAGPARGAGRAGRGARRRPGAMVAAGGAGRLRAGRWCPGAARAAGPGTQGDVVSNRWRDCCRGLDPAAERQVAGDE